MSDENKTVFVEYDEHLLELCKTGKFQRMYEDAKEKQK